MKRLLFLLPFLLISCSTKMTSLSTDVDILEATQELESDEYGYLLVAIDTNKTLHSLHISGKKNIQLTSSDLQNGTNFILLELPAGNYRFSKVKLSEYYYFEFDKKHWGFSVKPGVISYAGEFVIESKGWFNPTSKMELLNRSSFALEFMELQFPNILKSRKLEYLGPGDDDFLNFAQQLLNIHAAEK